MVCHKTHLFRIILSIPLLSLLILYFAKKNNKSLLEIVGLSIVLIGGTLNIADRLLSGCIHDYLNFFGLFMFNVNDLLVSSGIIILFVRTFYDKKNI